jgi:hypothetical protein
LIRVHAKFAADFLWLIVDGTIGQSPKAGPVANSQKLAASG